MAPPTGANAAAGEAAMAHTAARSGMEVRMILDVRTTSRRGGRFRNTTPKRRFAGGSWGFSAENCRKKTISEEKKWLQTR